MQKIVSIWPIELSKKLKIIKKKKKKEKYVHSNTHAHPEQSTGKIAKENGMVKKANMYNKLHSWIQLNWTELNRTVLCCYKCIDTLSKRVSNCCCSCWEFFLCFLLLLSVRLRTWRERERKINIKRERLCRATDQKQCTSSFIYFFLGGLIKSVLKTLTTLNFKALFHSTIEKQKNILKSPSSRKSSFYVISIHIYLNLNWFAYSHSKVWMNEKTWSDWESEIVRHREMEKEIDQEVSMCW